MTFTLNSHTLLCGHIDVVERMKSRLLESNDCDEILLTRIQES